jgi:hypothetical protein
MQPQGVVKLVHEIRGHRARRSVPAGVFLQCLPSTLLTILDLPSLTFPSVSPLPFPSAPSQSHRWIPPGSGPGRASSVYARRGVQLCDPAPRR